MSYHVCSCETFMRRKDHFIKVTRDGSRSCDMQAYKMMSEVLFLQILIVWLAQTSRVKTIVTQQFIWQAAQLEFMKCI